MFLDCASGPADGYLDTIELLKPPVLKLNDETVPDAQVQAMLTRAAALFSQGVQRWKIQTIGQHNHEVLVGELGISQQQYEQLIERGTIGDRPRMPRK